MTTTPPLRAMRITSELMEEVSIDRSRTMESLHESIGCQNFDVVGLFGGIDVFVDDEGAINGSPLNLFLTIIAHTLGSPAVLFGNGVALSVDEKTGESTSLSTVQINMLLRTLKAKPAPEVLARLAESLAPFPHIVDWLRGL